MAGWVDAQQLRERRTELRAREPVDLEDNRDDDGEQSLHPRIIEAQGRGALLAHDGGTDHPVPRVFTDGTVMTHSLDVEQTSVG